MQVIVYTLPDGKQAVITPAPGLSIEGVAAKDVPDGVPWEIVEASSILPTDPRTTAVMTRGAFCVVAEGIGILTEADAEIAATGAFPSSFEQYIATLSFAERVAVREAWAVERNVRYGDPFLTKIAELHAGGEAAGLALRDALFGIT